jgi:hypothetical protein
MSSYADDKVCVIGIIGKGGFGYKSKARHINSAIGKDLFKVRYERILYPTSLSKTNLNRNIRYFIPWLLAIV